MLQYIPYILLFAVAAAIIYAWGLWRSMRQQQELSNLLCARGVAKVKKALQKNGRMSVQDLEKAVEGLTAGQPCSKEKIKVTDTKAFLDSILPYMIRQRIIMEEEDGGKVWYRLRK